MQRALASEQVLSHTNDGDKLISITDANNNAVLPPVQDTNFKGKKTHCHVIKPRFPKFDKALLRDNNVAKNRKVSVKASLGFAIKLLQKIFCESGSAFKDKSTPYCNVIESFRAVAQAPWSRITPAGIG